MHGWLDGCMGEYMDIHIDRQVDEWMDRWKNRLMDELVVRQMVRNGWMVTHTQTDRFDEQMNERKDG